ncbi:hypothetical protein D9M68_784110 [compost metagenome]
MALMIDVEPLLPLLERIDAANEPRRALVAEYQALPQPSDEQTTRFLEAYQKARVNWANACGALVSRLGEEAEAAKRSK